MSYAGEVLADSPTAYWRLGESSGTTAADETGTHAGTYVNTPTLGVAGATGDGNTAVSFAAASSEYVALTTLGTLGSSLLTSSWEIILATTTTANPAAVFGTISTGSTTAITVNLNQNRNGVAATGTTRVFIRGQNGATLNADFTAAIFDGLPHHIVVVVESSTTISVTVDGVAQVLTYAAGSAITGGDFTHAVHLAGRNNRGTPGEYADVTVHEFAAYATRLSGARIAAHYAALTPAVTPGGTPWSQATNGFEAEVKDTGCATSLNTNYGNLLTATSVDATNDVAKRTISETYSSGTGEGRLFCMVKLQSAADPLTILDTLSLTGGEGPFRVVYEDGQLTLRASASMTGAAAATDVTALSPVLWNNMTIPLEVAWKEGAGNGFVRLYVGGALVANHENLTSSADAGEFSEVGFGIVASANATAKTVKIGQGVLAHDAATALWTANAAPTLAHATEYGVHQDLGYEGTVGVRQVGYDALAYLGAKVSRHTLMWDKVEATDGVAYDWSLYDEIVDGVEAAGAEVLFMASSTPTWANGGATRYAIPGTGLDATFTGWVADFCTFVTAAVNRYKPGGTHGSNVVKWEVWNEPNLPDFWGGGTVSPDQYAYLYNAVRTAILAAHAGAQVAMGVFSTWLFIGTGLSGMEFMGELLLRGATFNRLSLHAYDSGAPTVDADFNGNFTDFAATSTTHHFPAHEYLELIGREVPMWLTEWGWSFTLGEATQATYIGDALDIVAANWTAFTEVVTLFSDRDIGGLQDGIFNTYVSGSAPSPRLAATTFRDAVGEFPAEGGSSITGPDARTVARRRRR